jgi:hypothetical protein
MDMRTFVSHISYSLECAVLKVQNRGGTGGSQTGRIRFVFNLKGVKYRADGRDTRLWIVGNHIASDAALHPWRPEF